MSKRRRKKRGGKKAPKVHTFLSKKEAIRPKFLGCWMNLKWFKMDENLSVSAGWNPHSCLDSLREINPIVNCLLLSESLLFLLAPHVHHLPVFVHLHGVLHQPIHVDELDALLLSVKQHGRDDSQLAHLLLCVLTITSQQPSSVCGSEGSMWMGKQTEGFIFPGDFTQLPQ